MSLQTDLERIKNKMEQLKNHPKKDKLFGAGLDKSIFGHDMYDHIKTGHEYQLEKIMSKSEVESLEIEWEVKLPDDYKLFITEVGNGGMGPFYGLLPLQLDPEKQTNHIKDMICLAHEGCGYYHHLGVKGDKLNKLYINLKAAGDEVYELRAKSFFQWYEAWLDQSIKTLN